MRQNVLKTELILEKFSSKCSQTISRNVASPESGCLDSNVKIIIQTDFLYLLQDSQISIIQKSDLETKLILNFDQVKSMQKMKDGKVALVIFKKAEKKFMRCELSGVQLGNIGEILAKRRSVCHGFESSILGNDSEKVQGDCDSRVVYDENSG